MHATAVSQALVSLTALFQTVSSGIAAVTALLAWRSSLKNRAELVKTNAKVEQVGSANLLEIQKTNAKVEEVVGAVQAVHVATNSLTDRLVASTDLAAHARGVAEGVAATQAAADAKAISHAEGRADEVAHPGGS
jgi:sensor histidine kinase regulating citrate/malate metabolism